MADNIAVTPGSGTSVSTEEVTTLNGATVSAQHVQRVIMGSRTADGAVDDIDMSGGTAFPLASSAASTNATNVKASAGTIDGVKGKNTAAYAVYVRLYNNASTPTVGGGTSIDILEFPASMSQPGMYDFPAGLKCSAGIGFAIVKSDGSAVAAGDLTNFTLYYR